MYELWLENHKLPSDFETKLQVVAKGPLNYAALLDNTTRIEAVV